MTTRALTQACCVLRAPPRPACSFRCSSTTSREPTRAAPPKKPRPSNQQKPGPSGQDPRRNDQKQKSIRIGRGAGGGAAWSRINPMVVDWAGRHNVGFPEELKRAKLQSKPGRRLQVMFSPRPVLRLWHVLAHFTGLQGVLTEYWLYRYEEQLSEPLWLHLTASHNVKPVVRNFARRRVREGIREALAEKGYTFGGKVAEGGEGGAGGARRDGPMGELKGTIHVHVNDPVFTFNHDKKTHVEFGREIVRLAESQLSASKPRPRRG